MRGYIKTAVSLVGAVALVLGAAPAPSADVSTTSGAGTTDPAWPVDTRGDGCPSPVWPTTAPRNDPRRVLIIGDSLIRNARDDLTRLSAEAGWLPTIRCWGAKGTDWGVQQVKRARQLKQLPRTVVISLGTNDIWWLGLDLGRGVDSMMAALGPKVQVYWVNLHFGPHGYDRLPAPTAANRLLRTKAKQYSNLKLVNFAKAFRQAQARGEPVGWEDGVHLNATGNLVRSRAIVEALGSPRATVRR